MFSIKTRRRIITGLIVLVYAGILAFVPLVMWPQMQENREDITTLEEGVSKVNNWRKRIESGEFDITESHLQVMQDRLEQVKATYGRMKQYCMERDRILERPDLLDTTSAYTFKQDYLSLVNHWQESSRTTGDTEQSESLEISPSYGWASEEGAMPARGDYGKIIKQTAVVDAVFRAFCRGNGQFKLSSIIVQSPREPKETPKGPGADQFGAVRYRIWPATVRGVVPFSSGYRQSIAQVATAPEHAVRAPRKVVRDPEEPRYLPRDEENYALPCVKIRSIEFKPAGVNWVEVTVSLDIYDFSARETGR